MKRILFLCLCLLLAACAATIPTITLSTPTKTITPTSEPSQTPQPLMDITPFPSATPWIFESGLSIEEHPLAKPPESDVMILYPLDNLTQEQMLEKHASEFQKSLPYESYYGLCFCTIWAMQGKDKLETLFDPATVMPDHKISVGVTRNGKIIFTTLNMDPGTTNGFRVLTTYDDHWVLELAERKEIQGTNGLEISFLGKIFIDGKSLNELKDYKESFGFQTIHGRPFYFYNRNGKIGVSFDGQEIPLGYDNIPHYGCCSGGAYNPRMAENIVAFFGIRGEQWDYVEIGIFNSSKP